MEFILLPEMRRKVTPIRQRDGVPVVTRQQFLDKFANDYRSGQHVTLIGPTQRGKTTLCHEMLDVVITPDNQAVVFAGKPPSRDPTMERAADRLDLRIVNEWPPTTVGTKAHEIKRRMKGGNPYRGYVLRPEHDMGNPEATEKNLQRQFRNGLVDNYKSKKPRIVVVDEGAHVSRELKLEKYMDTILMRGAPVVSLWVLVQRGRYMSYMIYDQPEWFLLAYDPDRSNQRRYGDIGGVDPLQVMDLQTKLKTRRVETGGTISEFLCIRRSGPELFIVDVE